MSRLRVVHTSAFRYTRPVVASYNEARMTPRTEPGQRVISSRVDVMPQTWTYDYQDYWGSSVTVFEVLAPHESLLITAEHVVEVEPDTRRADVGWDALADAAARDRFAEFLTDTPTTAAPDEVVELARRATAGATPGEAAEQISLAVRDALEYVPGVTTVHTPAAEAWASRTGVCQDISHLAVGALRSVGIPARYVSGYVHPTGDLSDLTAATGESHAWVEWWTGRWNGYDPTNRRPVGEHHVAIARGRSYDDVPPLRGIFAGTSTQDLTVHVRITRED